MCGLYMDSILITLFVRFLLCNVYSSEEARELRQETGKQQESDTKVAIPKRIKL